MITKAKVTQGGRVVIPAGTRKRLGIRVGGTVNFEEEGDRLVLSTTDAALRRLQEGLKGTVPPGVSIVDELIADRRKDAENE